MAKCWRRVTLLSMVALPLLSPVGFCRKTLGRAQPIVSGLNDKYMKYGWYNLSWKRMEAKSKQEDYQSKLARDMHSFHHGGSNGFNAYGQNNHGNGNFTHNKHVGVGNFSFYAKSFEHTSYDDYGDYGRFYFLNSLGTLLEKKYFMEFNSISCAIPRVDECHFNIANYVSYVLGIEYAYAISFSGGLFLVVPYVSKCLSSHVFLEDSLLQSDVTLFDILHDKCLGKFVENVGYVSSFLDTFMEDPNDFVSLNQLMSIVIGEVEFSCNEQKLSNVINSLNTLFENIFGFQFYHLHFKEFLLKDFESRMGVNLELVKVSSLAFEKSNLRNEAFEQVCKDFVVGYLYYDRPFKEWFFKNNMSLVLSWKNSCVLTLKHEFEASLFYHLLFKEFFDKMFPKRNVNHPVMLEILCLHFLTLCQR
ncbi:hypothetical protein M9H77_02873 [Catharanthus roseus]|uniref:Uncharacterized protein n=1 Tax=Catharanthus roseus TaxID=4058 RepID=A0ACC0C9T1_CATRO|nr:hypothetical protein M9H77_02873 [Catharanthus roseus]